MVRAILDGRKTQTRRIIRDDWWRCLDPDDADGRAQALTMCPYGVPGDRLWVRETWRAEERASDGLDGVRFRADDAFAPIGCTLEAAEAWVAAAKNRHDEWRPSIFMPRWASRITLEVTAVRIERVQEISEVDAKAEGVTPFPYDPEGDCWNAAQPERAHRTAFEFLWGAINGWECEPKARAPWSSNPWVWVMEFRRVLVDG
jgi:hypothetical protein